MKHWIATVAFVVACSGGGGKGSTGSGLSGTARVSTLADSDVGKLCDYLASVLPERVVECGGESSTLGEGGAAMCKLEVGALPDGCTITVDQYEACTEAIDAATDAELCMAFPSACDPLFSDSCRAE